MAIGRVTAPKPRGDPPTGIRCHSTRIPRIPALAERIPCLGCQVAQSSPDLTTRKMQMLNSQNGAPVSGSQTIIFNKLSNEPSHIFPPQIVESLKLSVKLTTTVVSRSLLNSLNLMLMGCLSKLTSRKSLDLIQTAKFQSCHTPFAENAQVTWPHLKQHNMFLPCGLKRPQQLGQIRDTCQFEFRSRYQSAEVLQRSHRFQKGLCATATACIVVKAKAQVISVVLQRQNTSNRQLPTARAASKTYQTTMQAPCSSFKYVYNIYIQMLCADVYRTSRDAIEEA